MREFSVEWLLKRAKEELKELKSMTKDKEYYYTIISHMRELEDNIKYMEKLLKEETNETNNKPIKQR